MKHHIISLGLLICVAGQAAAEERPTMGHKDPRMRTMVYDPNQVTRLSTGVGAALVVTFSPDETVSAVAATDSRDLEASPRGNYLFIKSRVALPPQPIIVLTTGPRGTRRYVFEVETTAIGGLTADKADLYYSVEFVYPGDLAATRIKTSEARRENEERHRSDQMKHAAERLLARQDRPGTLARPSDKASGNWHYVAQGNSTLRPIEVHDDGYSTVFRFAGNTRIPGIFRLNPDGREAVASYAVEGDEVIVSSVAPEWRLRDGHTVLSIWNRAYSRVGVPPGTGTTSRYVKRVTKVGL